MILQLERFKNDKKSTLGLLSINGEFECFVLEDAERCEKISGETSIPKGKYYIKFREEITPLTQVYRDRFKWFIYHLQLQNVPLFSWIYIHIGNFIKDTDGCLLVADTAVSDPENVVSHIEQSTQAFKRVYLKISEALKKKEDVLIMIE